jgi:hypothetical protein
MKNLALIVVLVAFAVSGCGEPTTERGAKRARQATARETITATELMDKIANYDGSVVIVTGKFQKYRAATPLADGPMIWVGPSIDKDVPCVFPRSEDEQLKSIKIGETISIKGKAELKLGSAVMKNCTLQ